MISPEMAAKLRGRQMRPGHYLTPPQEQFHQNLLQAQDRININLPPAEHVYSGEWRLQGAASTCTAWICVNASLVLGREMTQSCIEEMEAYALGKNSSGKIGMSLSEAQTILSSYPDLRIRMRRLDNWEDVLPDTHQKKLIYDKKLGALAIFGGLDGIWVSPTTINLPLEARALNNAIQLKRLINEHGVILMGVDTNTYTNGEDQGSHAICISGYRINNNGSMDVQIVDSGGKGIYWTTLEFICQANLPLHTFEFKLISEVDKSKIDTHVPSLSLSDVVLYNSSCACPESCFC